MPHVLRRYRTARSPRALAMATLVLLIAVATAHTAVDSIGLRGTEQISNRFSRDVSVASGSADRMAAAWTQIASPGGIYVSDLRLGSWLRPELVPGSSNGESSVIAMSPNGSTLVAWEVQRTDPHSGQIGVSWRTPGGDFTRAQYLGSVTGGAANVDLAIAVNDSGRSAIVWTHAAGGARSVEASVGARATFGAVQQLDASASGASVAIDQAGNAIALYGQADYLVRQTLAPAGGAFAPATTLDPFGPGEASVSNNMRVRSNAAGQVVAGWGDQCDSADTACTQLFFNRMGFGSTTSGITSSQRVSNPYEAADAQTGPSRKSGGTTEVAIDESGHSTMVWDASDASIAGWDLWAARATPAGAVGSSVSIGTATDAVASELQVAAVDGSAFAAWVNAPAAGQPSTVYFNQANGTDSSWFASGFAASGSGVSGDQLAIGYSGGGMAALAFRIAGDRIAANTTATKDSSIPTMTLPPRGMTLRVRSGSTQVRLGCPRTEGSCAGTASLTMLVRGAGGASRSVTLGTGSFYVLGGRTVATPVRLNRAGRARLAASGRLPNVLLRVKVRDAAGNKRDQTRSIALA